jgi:hypothetical protein
MARFTTFFFVVLLGCTRPNPDVCHDDQCIDPTAPFCDVDGVVAGEPGQCIAVSCNPLEFEACRGDTALVCNDNGTSFDRLACQDGCDVLSGGCRTSCSALNAISCVDGKLTECNETGTGTRTTQCPLGCATGELRCNVFEPSNGLGPAFQGALIGGDVSLPHGALVDTDTGTVRDANGALLSVAFDTVSQVNAPTITVFKARSFVLSEVTYTGSNAVAYVARGSIDVRGRQSLHGHGSMAGPGASTSSTCRGGDTFQYSCVCSGPCSVGTGGGGGRSVGGRGGASAANGGSMPVGFLLAGGCSGGNQFATDSVTILSRGGGGGGAIQFVAGNTVTFQEQGLINVGGGGGASTTGGGSGGLVIVEAPTVNMIGTNAGVVANGGAGGGCGMNGPDALLTASQALGAFCPNFFAGHGGTGGSPPGNGCIPGVDNCEGVCPVVYGGGGGSGGRLRIFTKDGGYGAAGQPLQSAGVTTGVLVPK